MQETKIGNVTVVKAPGRLDTVTAPEFEKQLMALVNGGSIRVVVDATAMDYVSSAGLRTFLSIAKRLQQAKGKLTLGGLTHQVKEIFDIAGFSGILPIFATSDEAVKACQPTA